MTDLVDRPGIVTEEPEAITPSQPDRLTVNKTYKLYIGGSFPRTESGRYERIEDTQGALFANASRASRKDFREAVVAARGAFPAWSGRNAYNRGQILYRIAEVLEGRSAQFVEEARRIGLPEADARTQIAAAVDRLVYYAGWTDKYQQIFSSVNPVASSHFNFSMLEPTGVVGILAPEETSILGLVSSLAPVLCGGNTAVVLASGRGRLSAISFAEVLNASDVPAGVSNILTGRREELIEPFASHMDVNAVVYCGRDREAITTLQQLAVSNLKRVVVERCDDWQADDAADPYRIAACQETKTTWHPVGR